MNKKMISTAMATILSSLGAANTGCSSEVGVPLRDAAISAGATFVEATVLELLNNLFEAQDQAQE